MKNEALMFCLLIIDVVFTAALLAAYLTDKTPRVGLRDLPRMGNPPPPPSRPERYPMTNDQAAQIDCRVQECVFNRGGGTCGNQSPAVTLNERTYNCWSKINTASIETKDGPPAPQPPPGRVIKEGQTPPKPVVIINTSQTEKKL